MAAELLHSRLPHPWDYGVTEDGRIFFINDESKSTTWLHPVYNHPIQSGHLSRQDLPKGWELAFTAEGIPYYVDHTNLRTSFIHPVTGESALPVHENRPSADIYNNKNFKRSSLRRSSKKQKVIDKAPEPKRTRDGPVALRGWLYKQDTGGLKSWKKRWFVLSDFCLYYYKDQTESQLQGSILLPSYEIGFCNKSDGVNRKYSFKAEHQNMRTYYFATDNSEDQSSWMTALKLATQLKQHPNEDFKENSFPSSQNPSLMANSQLHDNSHLEDSGGFNESRSPLSTLGDQSPNSRGATMRSSLDDPAWYRDNPQSDPNSLWDKDESRYEADLRMRSRPGMRNMYVTREPAYPDPRPIYDNGSQDQDQSVISQNQNSYRVMDRESMSSYGSHGILPRDHNYNVPKDQYPEPLSRGNVRSSQQDANTLEQSTDSVERTLDRSFDSVEVLPGYDSFAENHLQSSGQLQHTNESSVLSRNSSIVEVQRQNSLLRLQQWTKRQRDATPGRGISGYGNRNEPPPSDGIRKYGQDNMRKSQGLPGNYAPVSPSSQNARPKQPTPMVLSSPDADAQPARPPIPAEYREQYIRELAETKTPHTRNDLLTSIEIQRIKQQQPLVFQYPEVSMSSDPPSNPQYNQQSIHYSHPQAPEGLGDLHLGPQSGQNASTQPKHGPPSQPGLVTLSSSDPGFNQSVVQHQERFQYEQLQQTENRPNNRELSTEAAVMEKRSQNVIDPSKSWDDLNDLDPDSAQFKYNNRIEQLLAEKRRIMGETADMLKTQSSCYPEETRGFIQAISPGEQENVGEIKGHVKTDEAKQARQHVEPTFTGVRYDNIYENMPYLLAAPSAPGAENIWPNQKSTHRASPRSPSSAGYARSMHAMPDGQNSNDPQTNNHTWPPSISQSECNTSFHEQPSLVGEKLQRTSHPVESRNVENVQQSLGKLHIDVGEWPEGGQFPYRPPNQMASRPLSSQKESLLGRMSPHLGNTITEDHDMVENTGYPDDQQHLVNFSRRDIETIKEDPNMSDQDILTTKTLADLQRHLSGHRLRLSISAGDLIGKSHEELVLLLIQLRRDQSRLERARDYYRAKLDVYRPQEKDYKLKRKNSVGRLHDVVEKEHDQYVELRKIYDELENQLEVSKPLVNLLDNMVRMGSLYGGDNLMLASQYKQHKLRPGEYTPPKKMITFSRQYQEQKLSQLQEAELKQLMDDEVDLEDKLQQLYQLDRELQEKSLAVTNLQENKDLLESTVAQLRKDIQMTSDPRTIQNMKYQLRHLESELVTVRQQLAESSKLLEETSAEDARVENEVMLLRKKIYGLNRTHSTPSLTNDSVRARQQLEQELEGVQNVMNSLSKQGVVLSDTIKALRHSTPDLTASGNVAKSKTTYLETDMDTGRSRDLTKEANLTGHEVKYSKSPYSNVKTDDSYIYASVKKTRRQDGDWETRDRSRSEPPAFDQSNKWRSDRETTNRKTAISPMSGNAPEQALAPRDNLEYMASGYSEDIRRGQGPSSEEGKPLRYDGNQQHNVQSGVFRAEMQVVTPDNNKYYREDSMDRLHQQQSQLRDYQVGLNATEQVKVTSNSIHVQSVKTVEAKVSPHNPIFLHGTQLPPTSDPVSVNKGQLGVKTRSGEMSSGDGSLSGNLHVPPSFTNCVHNVDTSCTNSTIKHFSKLKQSQQSSVKASEDRSLAVEDKDENQANHLLLAPDQRTANILCRDRHHQYNTDVFPVSDLTRSLMTSKEQVIRRALKRVSSDTSDTSMSEVNGTHTRALDDYLNKKSDQPSDFDSDKTASDESSMDQDKSSYGQNWSLREQQLGSKPMSEVHPQQQQQSNQQQHQQKHYDQEGQVYFTANDSQIYRPIELSQADENTKKFFGILPKDMARSQTVREVKKEAERRSRERKRFYVNVHGSLDLQQAGAMSEEFQRSRSLPHKTAAPSSLNQSGQSQDDSTLPWRKSVGVYRPKQQVKPERHLSAADRLFPKQSDGTTINPNSRDSVRRMSDIFSPRPFSSSVANQKATQPSLKSFSDIHQGHPVTIATVRPVVNNKEQQGIDEIMGGKRSRSTEDLMKNEVRVQEYRNERLKSRHNTRGRFMTISSTEPIRMESGHAGWKPSKHQTAAGDLISGHWHDVPDCVRSEPLKDFHFDSETIDREVLYVPDKVDIPDRYVPDSDDEETPEDRERRLAKGEQIKRMLAAQSLAEWKQEEVGLRPRSGTLHKQVEAERKRREHILDLKQALAVQVTQRSKQVAERFLEKQNEQLENGTADLKKSELSLALLGDDGCGYVPALAPAVARKLCADEYLTNTSCELLAS